MEGSRRERERERERERKNPPCLVVERPLLVESVSLSADWEAVGWCGTAELAEWVEELRLRELPPLRLLRLLER